MMSGESYDRDVKHLISEVEQAVEFVAHGGTISEFTGFRYTLEQALAPFRPDPEEQLIEAMAKAYADAFYKSAGADQAFAFYDDAHRKAGLIAALAVIKEKGYFNDQR